ncbi:MAG: choice-of-anchor J domain-containing protein [Bacteroidales bacterium]|nr:choice-of-anchor J domain-containing protein [Bacteroidales bacterium]MBQ6100972.1 choice-of-anchor J domain-containing protein [Bacteroidales bacterium]
MKKTLLILAVMLMGLGAMAQSTYTKVTSESELNAGDKVLLVGIDDNGQAWAMSYQKPNNRKALAVTMNDNAIVTTVATDPSSQTEPYEITIGGQAGAWTFFDELNNGYLYAPGGGNYLKTQTTNDNKGEWTLSLDGEGFVPTSNGGVEQNIMRYNPNSQNSDPLFGCYKPSSSVNGLVYIFRISGAPVINPEPSNYPTNFAASVAGTDVTLMWNDATGSQLPAKYLVMGSTGTIVPPVDGQPVPNGDLVVNVAYGVEAVTFSELNPNTTYNFAIFPYTNSGENIDYKTDGSYPTTQAAIGAIAYLLEEDFESGLGMFTEYSIVGDQVWEQGEHNDNHYANMNGYAEGSAHENHDWLISPEIPFNRDFGAIMLEFKSAKNYTGDNIRVMISSDFTGGDPTTDGYWEDITEKFNLSTGSFSWVESGRVNVLDIISNQLGFFHFAFVYTSTDEHAAAWEIDDVKVIGGMVSVEENQLAAVSVYPNPAHEMVSFNLESDAQVNIFDMTGRMVSTMSMAKGQGQYSVAGLENGVYFLNIRYNDGKTEVARFVKF